MRRTTQEGEDNTMQCSVHAERATDSEAQEFSKCLPAFRPKLSDRVINIGQMEKALVHSSPSSASVLLPVASTSTDAAEARKPGQGFVSQDLPVAKGYSRVASTSTLGFCNPRIQFDGPRRQIAGTSHVPDRRGFEA